MHGAGRFAMRQTQAALACEGAFPLPGQKSYQQVVGHMMVARGRASVALAFPSSIFHASHTPGLTLTAAPRLL